MGDTLTPDRQANTANAANRQESLFPDADLVTYVTVTYGPVMGCKCEDIFNDDPDNESGFANSIRRSLTREIARKADRHA